MLAQRRRRWPRIRPGLGCGPGLKKQYQTSIEKTIYKMYMVGWTIPRTTILLSLRRSHEKNGHFGIEVSYLPLDNVVDTMLYYRDDNDVNHLKGCISILLLSSPDLSSDVSTYTMPSVLSWSFRVSRTIDLTWRAVQHSRSDSRCRALYAMINPLTAGAAYIREALQYTWSAQSIVCALYKNSPLLLLLLFGFSFFISTLRTTF